MSPQVAVKQQDETPKENYIAKSTVVTGKSDSKTAKLSQKIMFELASGKKDISRSALQFMLYTISFVAKDGRIYVSLEDIKNTLNLQKKTLVRVIEELEELGLLSKKGDFFYSHFHVLSNGKKQDETYVRNLKEFTSPTVLNLKKNELRFFLYVASRGVINPVIKLSTIESLYSNRTHKGVNYIDSYLNLSTILNTLVSNDLIEVHIEKEVFKKSNIESFLPVLHQYCGYKEDARKKRMSKNSKHVIGFRINPELWEDEEEKIRKNEAGRREIEYFADKNCFFHSHMRPNTIPNFIKEVQDPLFDRFGLTGLEMYREALITYFATEGDNVIYHDLYADEKTSKAINTMVDFFLIPSIIDVIAAAASSEPSEDRAVNYFKNKENLLALVDYFNEIASDNHIILLEEALEKVNVSLNDIVKTVPMLNPTENSWFLLQAKTKHIYNTVNYSESVLSSDFQKNIVREWAKNGLFTQKNLLNKAVKALKSKVVFLPKEQYADVMNELNQNNPTKKVYTKKSTTTPSLSSKSNASTLKITTDDKSLTEFFEENSDI